MEIVLVSAIKALYSIVDGLSISGTLCYFTGSLCVCGGFFFVSSFLHSTYIDHGNKLHKTHCMCGVVPLGQTSHRLPDADYWNQSMGLLGKKKWR